MVKKLFVSGLLSLTLLAGCQNVPVDRGSRNAAPASEEDLAAASTQVNILVTGDDNSVEEVVPNE